LLALAAVLTAGRDRAAQAGISIKMRSLYDEAVRTAIELKLWR
jgi:hypothetical protein